MGANASQEEIHEALAGASDEQLKAALRELPEPECAKLEAALAKVASVERAWPQNGSREEKLRHAFAKCEEDRSGRINLEELARLAGDAPFNKTVSYTREASGSADARVAAAQWVKLCMECDSDMSDGAFDEQLRDWLFAVAEARYERSFPESAPRGDQLAYLFRLCDSDSCGHVCAEEFRRMAGDSHFVEAVLGMIDQHGNNDGRVSESEFVKFMLARSKEMSGDEFRESARKWLRNLAHR